MDSQALDTTEAFSAARSTAPRVSLDSMKAKIASELYFTVGSAVRAIVAGDYNGASGMHAMLATTGGVAPGSLDLLTVCMLTMSNGFVIIGKSAPASAANFDEVKGRTFAFEDAIKRLWPLEGYALREKLALSEQAPIGPREGVGRFVGTKVLNAKPMTRGEWCALRKWTVPANENPADEGYVVEYTDRHEPNFDLEGFEGYVSWSPKAVFEASYQRVG